MRFHRKNDTEVFENLPKRITRKFGSSRITACCVLLFGGSYISLVPCAAGTRTGFGSYHIDLG